MKTEKEIMDRVLLIAKECDFHKRTGKNGKGKIPLHCFDELTILLWVLGKSNKIFDMDDNRTMVEKVMATPDYKEVQDEL